MTRNNLRLIGFSAQKKASASLIVFLITIGMFGFIIEPAKSSGTIYHVPTDFSSIQQAINAVSSGDIIEVAAGVYNEHLVISKALTLRGDNCNSVILEDGSSRIIDVTVSNVEISGFTIQDGTQWRMGIHVESWPEPLVGINITNNVFVDTYYGVYLSYCQGAVITNNTIENPYYGIRLHESDSNTIAENIVTNSGYYGLNLYSHSQNNYIYKNTLSNCKYGILHEYSDSNILELNRISFNTEYGLRLSYSSGNIVTGNDFSTNKYGVYLWESTSNSFYYNSFVDNTNQIVHSNVDPPFDQTNTWDDTNYPPSAKGNYWSNYAGLDNGIGTGRWGESRTSNDKIGDTRLPHEYVDWYPLMVPWMPVPTYYPVALFSLNPIEPISDLEAVFNASISYDPDGTLVSYLWNFGDGTPEIEENDPVITHIYENPDNYTVTLTVSDNDGLENSTSKLITVHPSLLMIDLYSEHPEPYSGKGLNKPCDAFAPQENVFLYAEVTKNYDPVENKEVTFLVTDAIGNPILSRTASTNSSGIAEIDFSISSSPAFGTWKSIAVVEVSEEISNDTMDFEVGWILELLELETTDQNGILQTSFKRMNDVYFDVVIKNIGFTSKSAILAITLEDETGQPIGLAYISLEVPSGVHILKSICNLNIPRWCYVGLATGRATLLNAEPTSGGIPYCPETSSFFYIQS